MRVCTTYGSPTGLRPGSMHEIRLDVFDIVPECIGENDIITLCGKDISLVSKDFKGMVDVGDNDMDIPFRKIRSIHDFRMTPSSEDIVRMMSTGDQELSKGAFMVSSFTDLHNIHEASTKVSRKHLILGMGIMGEITRLRQRILNNDFTFGYHGVSTASGQFSSDAMEALGDDCRIVGITGHPLSHSKSPAMQNAAMADRGINGIYLTFDSPDLAHIGDVIREYDIRGMNVTIPYKQEIISHLDSLSTTAEKVGAVNTVVNDNGQLTGHNTDVKGIQFAVENVQFDNVLIMGSGGAARAAAYAFTEKGHDVSISGRNMDTVSQLCRDFGISEHKGDVKGFDMIVNCTPIGLVDGSYPSDISILMKDQTVFDMVYGRSTPLTESAMKRGCRVIDGEEMLIGQGAESFRLWFDITPDTDVMRGALR